MICNISCLLWNNWGFRVPPDFRYIVSSELVDAFFISFLPPSIEGLHFCYKSFCLAIARSQFLSEIIENRIIEETN